MKLRLAALAALTAGTLGASMLAATPAQATWQIIDGYDTANECHQYGQAGIAAGNWTVYKCKYLGPWPGVFLLWADI